MNQNFRNSAWDADETENGSDNAGNTGPAHFEKPSRTLVKMYLLAHADAGILSTYKTKYLTNAITTASWFKSIRPPVDESLRTNVVQPGAAASRAMTEYENELVGAVPCKPSTTAAVAIGILSEDHTLPRAAHLDMIVKICCASTTIDEIYEMAATTLRTGRYDRSRAHKGMDLSTSLSSAKFDATQSEVYSDWWEALWYFVRCYFGSNAAMAHNADSTRAERVWTAYPKGEFRQLLDSAGDLIAMEAIHLNEWEHAEHGTQVVTPKQRVNNMMLAARPSLTEAFNNRIGLMNRKLHTYYKDWDEFTTEFELAEDSEQKSAEVIPAENKAANATTSLVALPIAQTTGIGKDECWNWTMGICTYGDNCRNKHKGESGAGKHLECDDDGRCMKFKIDRCTRKKCPFSHDPISLPMSTTGIHQKPADRKRDAPMRCF